MFSDLEDSYNVYIATPDRATMNIQNVNINIIRTRTVNIPTFQISEFTITFLYVDSHGEYRGATRNFKGLALNDSNKSTWRRFSLFCVNLIFVALRK